MNALGVSRLENEKSLTSTVVAKEVSAPRPKKFFKSRDPPEAGSASSIPKPAEQTYSNASKKTRISNASPEKELKVSRTGATPKKFFSSKNNCAEKTVLSANVNNSQKRAESKPPIVLRICRGKSQLLNDSDESESTPTPSSTPSTSTSPRTRRDSQSKSPSHGRITRSTRRSMQQDPSSSPATADTPGEFSLFSSPKKDSDLSPQYIPAERYEAERRAMYDNLLRANSPKREEEVPLEVCTIFLISKLTSLLAFDAVCV